MIETTTYRQRTQTPPPGSYVRTRHESEQRLWLNGGCVDFVARGNAWQRFLTGLTNSSRREYRKWFYWIEAAGKRCGVNVR